MKLQIHIAVSVLVAVFLQPYFGLQYAVLAAIVSVLIDVDHWLLYMFKKGQFTLNPAKVIEWCKEIDSSQRVAFHITEFWVPIAICLLFIHPVIAIGYIVHIVTDVVFEPSRVRRHSIFWRKHESAFNQSSI